MQRPGGKRQGAKIQTAIWGGHGAPGGLLPTVDEWLQLPGQVNDNIHTVSSEQGLHGSTNTQPPPFQLLRDQHEGPPSPQHSTFL